VKTPFEPLATHITRFTEKHPALPRMNPATPAPRSTSDVIRTHAERMAHEAEERLQKRRLLLAEQCSSENPPDVRIRAWERAHALNLPSNPEHPVLHAIATSTGLTIAQVQEEQRVRRAPRAAVIQNPEAGKG
jgi:hypothetical protein